MKVPNKYFIHPGPLGLPTAATVNITGSDIEYIRKDFLTDKLVHAKALREKSGSRDTEVFDALINLIQEI